MHRYESGEDRAFPGVREAGVEARLSGRQMVAPVVRLGICAALIAHSPLERAKEPCAKDPGVGV